LPIIDQVEMAKRMKLEDKSALGGLITKVAVFSASDLRTLTILGLGIMPYISASIILQLLGSVYKPLEDLRKEGETGRKKINEYTRYLTVLMCLVQGAIYLSSMVKAGGGSSISPDFQAPGGGLHSMWYITV